MTRPARAARDLLLVGAVIGLAYLAIARHSTGAQVADAGRGVFFVAYFVLLGLTAAVIKANWARHLAQEVGGERRRDQGLLPWHVVVIGCGTLVLATSEALIVGNNVGNSTTRWYGYPLATLGLFLIDAALLIVLRMYDGTPTRRHAAAR